jgi:zinc protease
MSRLLTKDTENYSAERVVTKIESVGGGISSSVGNNSFGVTAYGLRPDVGLAVDLLGDALTKPAFLDEAVEREKQFQIAQIKAESDQPFSVAMRELRRQVFGNHPYAMSLSGSEASVSQLSRDSVIQLRKRLVKGGNGVVALFGDIDLGEAEDLIRCRFGNDIPSGEREFSKPFEFICPSGENRVVNLVHEKEQAVIVVGYRTVSLDHEDNIALDLIEEACSDMASRMFIRIREELGLAYSVGATRMQGLEPGMIIFYASTAPEKLEQVEEEMLREIELIANEGLTKEEFERAKASWLGKEVIHLQGVRELAGTASVDELVGLGWDHYRKAPGKIDAVSRNEIQDVAARYLSPPNRVIVRLTNPEAN